MPRLIRSFAAALVLLVLAAGAAQARTFAVRPASAGFFDSIWEWVSSYLPAWNKAGGTMDPDGLKEGGTMDPNGLKAGGMMDPNGSHLQVPPPPTADAGGMLDPDG